MQNEIKEKILEYLNDTVDGSAYLKPLDDPNKRRYTGVTLDYIYEWVLCRKYTVKEIAEALLELHDEKELTSLECSDVKNHVFQNKTNPWGYSTTHEGNYGHSASKAKEKLYKYLNQFIENGETIS